MELIVWAVDVGSGNTKFVTSVGTSANGFDIRCVSFPSIAYPSSDGLPAWPSSDRRKTVFIPVGALFYEVGPEVSLAADSFHARELHDQYIESPKYMALLRGALGMMKLSHIDLPVVGLPVALFAVTKAAPRTCTTHWDTIGNTQVGKRKTSTATPAKPGGLPWQLD